MINLAPLYKKINYTFKNSALIIEALSHRSLQIPNNERLEFLGDAILNFIIARELFVKFPKAQEGELSRLRANLVAGEALAELAQELTIGDYLRLGSGELKSGGFRRKSILADALEAIIGAIYLDANIDTCSNCLLYWYKSRLEKTLLTTATKDAKTKLQEYMQARKLPLPNYRVITIAGEAHQQTFHVQCTVEGITGITQDVGGSRRQAEQAAAAKFLAMLKLD